MKNFLALFLFATTLLSCNKLKDEVNGQLDNLQVSSVEADITVDGVKEHITPNVCNPYRVDNYYNIIASTIDNHPTVGVMGTFKGEGTYTRNETNDIFLVFRNGVGDDDNQLFNSDYNAPNGDEPVVVQIEITRHDGREIEGVFSGVVYNSKGKKCIVENGVFKAKTAI